jgi:6-phosphogluconate dehydrogenase
MWRGGCIIRSRFLGKIKEAYDKNPKLANLLLDDYFRGEIKKAQKGWRNIVATAAKKGIPVPAFSTALAFYDRLSLGGLPANLLQAQRDYFGAHTYERVDKPRGEFFHTNWTGRGGGVGPEGASSQTFGSAASPPVVEPPSATSWQYSLRPRSTPRPRSV